MQLSKAGVLIAAVVGWVTAQDPGPPPQRGAGQEGGARPPGRPLPDDGPGDPGDPPPPPPPPFGPPPNPLFLAIDLDHDGELSAPEIARASASILKLDRDKDGVLTEEEVRPPRPRGGSRGGPGEGPPGRRIDPRAFLESIMRFDQDSDGKVTARELPERMARLLEEGDANKDGSLDRTEIDALSRRQQARRPGPPGDGPPGPPDSPPAGPGGPRADEEDHGRPVGLVAGELGVTPEKFREVFRKVRPAGPGQRPTEAQRGQNRRVLSEGLGVSPERLDEVMNKYRPGGRGDNGPPRP